MSSWLTNLTKYTAVRSGGNLHLQNQSKVSQPKSTVQEVRPSLQAANTNAGGLDQLPLIKGRFKAAVLQTGDVEPSNGYRERLDKFRAEGIRDAGKRASRSARDSSHPQEKKKPADNKEKSRGGPTREAAAELEAARAQQRIIAEEQARGSPYSYIAALPGSYILARREQLAEPSKYSSPSAKAAQPTAALQISRTDHGLKDMAVRPNQKIEASQAFALSHTANTRVFSFLPPSSTDLAPTFTTTSLLHAFFAKATDWQKAQNPKSGTPEPETGADSEAVVPENNGKSAAASPNTIPEITMEEWVRRLPPLIEEFGSGPSPGGFDSDASPASKKKKVDDFLKWGQDRRGYPGHYHSSSLGATLSRNAQAFSFDRAASAPLFTLAPRLNDLNSSLIFSSNNVAEGNFGSDLISTIKGKSRGFWGDMSAGFRHKVANAPVGKKTRDWLTDLSTGFDEKIGAGNNALDFKPGNKPIIYPPDAFPTGPGRPTVNSPGAAAESDDAIAARSMLLTTTSGLLPNIITSTQNLSLGQGFKYEEFDEHGVFRSPSTRPKRTLSKSYYDWLFPRLPGKRGSYVVPSDGVKDAEEKADMPPVTERVAAASAQSQNDKTLQYFMPPPLTRPPGLSGPQALSATMPPPRPGQAQVSDPALDISNKELAVGLIAPVAVPLAAGGAAALLPGVTGGAILWKVAAASVAGFAWLMGSSDDNKT